MKNPPSLTGLVRCGLLITGVWLLGGCVSAPLTQAPPVSDCPPIAAALTPDEVKVGVRDARDRGFMWRIKKGDHSSYLYGTIHVARREWLFPGPALVSALRASDTIALEIDPLAPGVANSLVEGKGERQRGLTLPDSLLERLQRRIAAECLAPARMAKMGPEAQIAALNILASRRDGLDPTYATEIMLSGLGRNANKTVFSLEVPQTGMRALGAPMPDQRIAWLESSLTELETGRVRMAANGIAALWAASDYAELERLIESVRATPAGLQFMKRLLDDRNPALADGIDALHTSGKNIFVAVGSAHLVGPLGLPALLAERGYEVRRVEF